MQWIYSSNPIVQLTQTSNSYKLGKSEYVYVAYVSLGIEPP